MDKSSNMCLNYGKTFIISVILFWQEKFVNIYAQQAKVPDVARVVKTQKKILEKNNFS